MVNEDSLRLRDVTLRMASELDEEWLARLVDAYEALQNQTEEILAARRALEEERACYQDLFDFAPDGYLVTDLYGRILEANWAAAELLGTDRQKMAGKALTAYIYPDDRQEFDAQFGRISSGGECTVAWEMCFQSCHDASVCGSVKVI